MEVELPDGRVLEFPDGTSESVMRAAINRLLGGPQRSSTQEAGAPISAADRARADMRSRATVVEEFPSGGKIYRSAGGVETYMGTDGNANSDPAVIEMMRRTQDPNRVTKTQQAKDLVGENKTRFLSAMGGVPALRGFVGQLADFGAAPLTDKLTALGADVNDGGWAQQLAGMTPERHTTLPEGNVRATKKATPQ